MKKKKIVDPFSFIGLSHEDMVNNLNEDKPINIKYNEDLVNRVSARYPLINKSQVSLIIKAVFQSMRDLLILGRVLNFNNLLFDMKLKFYDYRKNGHILPALRVKISTPPPLRNK